MTSVHPSSRTAASCVASVLAAMLAATPVQADQRVEMLLSWDAPYGQNRAQDSITRACGDAPGADTLYLSYRLARDEPVLSGLTGLLLLHPQFDDTLGTPWNSTEQKPGFIKVEFPRDTVGSFRAGWKTWGFGDWRYFFDRGEGVPKGVIRMIFAVPATSASSIDADEIYCFARVIFERPEDAACREALCVEWMESKVAFSVNAVDVVAEQVRSSFVSVNSPGGLACAKYRSLAERRREQARLRRQEAIRQVETERREATPDSTHQH